MKRRKSLFLLLGILLLSGFLRIYQLPERFVFGFNEEYQATLAKSIVDDFHLIWIGVSAAHLDFYMGPFFTYLTAFWLFLSKGDLLLTGYVAAVIGVISTWLVYVVGKLVFNKLTALIGSLLYAVSPLLVFYDQKYWNPTPNTLLSLVTILSVILAQKRSWWWVLFFVCFGLIFHADLAAGPVVIPGLWLFTKHLKEIPMKVILASVIIFILLYSPLLVFDYFHNFSNLTTPFRLSKIIKEVDYSASPVNHVVVLANSLSRLWYLNPNSEATDESLATCDPLPFGLGRYHEDYPNERTVPNDLFQILIGVVTVIYVYFLFIDKRWNVRFIGWTIITFLVCFLFFPGGTFEYYLLTIYPLILFLPGLFLSKTYGLSKIAVAGLVILTVVLGIFTVISARSEYGLGEKRRLIAQVSDVVGDRSFELWERGGCHGLEGWRHLFLSYGKAPVKSSIDKTLGWIYPSEVRYNVKPEIQVVIVESRFPMNLESLRPLESIKIEKKIKPLHIFTRGGFTVYIFDIKNSGTVWD